MKKLLLIMALCSLFFACSNTPTESSLASKNNATDNDFIVTDKVTDGRNWFTVETADGWLNGYKRKGTGTGLIGEWETKGSYNEKSLTFKNDGTFRTVYTKSIYQTGSDNYIISNGTYEVFETNGEYYLKVLWSDREYNFKFLVSDSYFCTQGNSSPI